MRGRGSRPSLALADIAAAAGAEGAASFNGREEIGMILPVGSL
jgi:hypothetical protein